MFVMHYVKGDNRMRRKTASTGWVKLLTAMLETVWISCRHKRSAHVGVNYEMWLNVCSYFCCFSQVVSRSRAIVNY